MATNIPAPFALEHHKSVHMLDRRHHLVVQIHMDFVRLEAKKHSSLVVGLEDNRHTLMVYRMWVEVEVDNLE